MRATQAILSASFVLPALADADIDSLSQCNQGGAYIACGDATTACNQVHSYDYSFGPGQATMKIATYGSATVLLNRARSSKSEGDMNALCHQIGSDCCPSRYMTKSQIPFESGEQGYVQIISS
ncbi:hypothetical protein PILCRDRAFT_505747 [Piloderma croceum F 1598]|uniref:Hydrophobin n=1 Tax=Piloderma croceum (strain F 1598) TaxID=765440 RepID=A0A0C3BV79_PILCF|nr:hypothetical protein PILCRDRAFT_505747 [Piloderma croceum F 1598]